MAFKQPFGLMGISACKQDSMRHAGHQGGSHYLWYPTAFPSSCPINTSATESSPGTGECGESLTELRKT